MKIAILTNSPQNAPHIRIYVDLLKKNGIIPDIICWDNDIPINEFNFPLKREYAKASIFRLIPYLRFSRFAKKIIKKYRYEKLIINSSAVALFMPFFLKSYYKSRYIFDFRDLSIEQIPLFKPFMKMILKNSELNVLSSPAFKDYLPYDFEYVLSHNFNIELARKALKNHSLKPKTDKVRVLTIGSIRIDSNYEMIDALGNASGFELAFIGKSGNGSSELLKAYAKRKQFRNIFFEGYYRKEDEGQIFEKYNFVNIFYPQIPSHISALSNRFYNSLIYHRPMIVSKGGIQGEYVEKYGVGITITNCLKLPQILRSYYEALDFEDYQKKCDVLLNEIIKDYEIFEKSIIKIISS